VVSSDRNVLAWGEENQQKLAEKRVAVIGSDILAQLIIASLAGLGVGKKGSNGAVVNFDNQRISSEKRDILNLDDIVIQGTERVKTFEGTVLKINPECNYIPIFSPFSSSLFDYFRIDYVIDATNDRYSKGRVVEFCRKRSIPLVSASSSRSLAALTVLNHDLVGGGNIIQGERLRPLENTFFSGKQQFAYTSCVSSGLVLEELRKFCFRYGDGDNSLSDLQTLLFNPYSSQRRNRVFDIRPSQVNYFGSKKALVVGAGALGNFVALGLADLGIPFDIIDFDTIEAHNLNRQIFLYGREGEYKAEVLEQRLLDYNPRASIRSIKGKIGKIDKSDMPWLKELLSYEERRIGLPTADFRNKRDLARAIKAKYGIRPSEERSGITLFDRRDLVRNNYNLILGCVDNKFARIWLDEMAVRCEVPLIDGGTSWKAGSLAVYVPDVYDRVKKSKSLFRFPARYSCLDSPAGSVVMSNSIVGGMMVAEALKIINQQYEQKGKLKVEYNTDDPGRISVIRSRVRR